MSFSSEVKEELSLQTDSARHCQIAELTAIITMCGRVSISTRDRVYVKILTENLYVARKYSALLWKIFHIQGEVCVKQRLLPGKNRPRAKAADEPEAPVPAGKDEMGESGRILSHMYGMAVQKHEDAMRILQAARLVTPRMEAAETICLADSLIVQKSCCRRAFIRGAFLVSGSISDPAKFYHFEIACAAQAKAAQLKELLRGFELDAKIVRRKAQYVVYIKEGAQIVDVLNVMGAYRALMNLENIRIVREMRNTVNRKVNCETANIHKTVSAAVRQIEDIEYLRKQAGLETLPPMLAEIAALRLEQPEATLKELGQMLTPPVGKSGVNHRLRKLSELAEKLRGG